MRLLKLMAASAFKMLLALAGIALVASMPARAEKPLKDYSFIRGVNYGMQGDQAVLERDLGYAKRVNLNSTRIWLNYQGYERDPQGYVDRLRDYIRTSHRLGLRPRWSPCSCRLLPGLRLGASSRPRSATVTRSAPFAYDLGLMLKQYCLLY